MQKIVTASQMQAIDQSAIRQYDIPGLVLMENAGRGVTHLMHRHIPDLKTKKVTVVAGKNPGVQEERLATTPHRFLTALIVARTIR